VRACEPDRCGYAVRSGVRLYYEVFGSGPTTVLLLPPWAIVHSRTWKLQVPYLARHFRVVTFDPRGNGRSDRPPSPDDYADTELVADAVAVLDATDTDAAVCVGLSVGGRIVLQLATAHPERVAGAVFVAPAVQLGDERPRLVQPFEGECLSDIGWGRYNAEYWRRDLRGFAGFFFGKVFPEPHSSKQVEDAVEWTLETDAETLIATERASHLGDKSGPGAPAAARLAAEVGCPALVIHGDDDRIVRADVGLALAAAIGCSIEIFHGGGHCVQARHPVRFNLVLRRFIESIGSIGSIRQGA
jgi:pimeloyl-ACP methyl ester carboxylesterase